MYVSKADDNCQEGKPQRIEKVLRMLAVLQLSLCIRIKGGDRKEGYVKSSGGRLRGAESSNVGRARGLDKEKHCFYTGGCKIVNNQHLQPMGMVFEEQHNSEGFCALMPWVVP